MHEKQLERQLSAEDLLARYREPLAAAAFDLQSRCWNIVKNNFFRRFGSHHQRFADAKMTTLFRFAQYFGWVEILRREIQFLSFPEEQDTRRVSELLRTIAGRLASSDDGESLMIWIDEQRAIGERMIVEHRHGVPSADLRSAARSPGCRCRGRRHAPGSARPCTTSRRR